jgi:hypothetical protein
MIRKHSRSVLILAALAALAVAAFPKDKGKTVDSVWAAAPVKVDGLDQDWQGAAFLTDPDSKAQYALRNDGRNLYVLFLFKSPQAASTIDATGLKVFFGPAGGKGKDHGVHFLKKTLTAEDLIAHLEKQGETLTEERKAEIRRKKEYTLFEADVINPKKIPAPSDPAVKTESPAFGTRSRSGEIVYEFRVPLSRTNQPGGVGVEPGQALRLGFDWGGLTDEMKRAMMASGGGGSGRPPSLDGSVASERNDEAREGSAVLRHDPKTKQHAFWIDVKLAPEPAK